MVPLTLRTINAEQKKPGYKESLARKCRGTLNHVEYLMNEHEIEEKEVAMFLGVRVVTDRLNLVKHCHVANLDETSLRVLALYLRFAVFF